MKNNMIFIFGVKIALWTVWFSNTLQTNNIVVPFKFIILIFLKNFFLWGFSWKRYFICGRCVRGCWVNWWYWFQCFNQSKPFSCSPFFRNLSSKCLMQITAEDVGFQSFLLTNFIQQFLMSSSLGNENIGTTSSPLQLFSQFHPSKKDLQHHVSK